MATFPILDVKTYWKNISDWITSASTHKPKIMNINSSGTEIFTSANPGNVTLSGSNVLIAKVQNVTTAGTRVQLPDQGCREVTIIAKRENTGYIYVGGDDVSNSVYGAELEAKDSITLQVSNTNLIYIDASVSGEGISYVAI